MTIIYTFFLLLFSFFLLAGGSVLADNHLPGDDTGAIVQAAQAPGEEQIRDMSVDGKGKEKAGELKNNVTKKSDPKYYKKPKAARYPRCSECD